MRGLVVSGLLGLLASGGVEAQQQPTATTLAAAPFARGRALLVAARYGEAADTFYDYLGAAALDKFTIRVAVYCEATNLDAHLEKSGNPPELFVLRRPVGNQSCLGLYWGVFPSRNEADAALSAVPPALRTEGQRAAPIASLLAPGALPVARSSAPPLPTAPAPATPAQLTPAPPPTAVAPPAPQPLPANPPTAVTRPQAPGPALQQPPPLASEPVPPAKVPWVELAGGYSFLWDDSFDQAKLSGRFNLGWLASGAVNVTDSLGIVGEANGNYNSPDHTTLGEPIDPKNKYSLLGLHAGLRYTDRHDRVARPYAQVLFGATRYSASYTTTDQPVARGGTSIPGVTATSSSTDFSIQPGVGVVFTASERVGIDLGADYRLVFTDPYKTNEFRLHAGVVLGLGERYGRLAAASSPGSRPQPAGHLVAEGKVSTGEAVPNVELAAAYSYLWDDSFGEQDLSGRFNLGWLASGTVNVTDSLGIVGEANGNYNSPDHTTLGEPIDPNTRFSLLGLHAGPRYTDRRGGVARPYAQFLLGATRFSASDTDESVSSTEFSIQPGVGVVFRASETVGIDLGADYRLVFTDPYKTNEFRLHAGVVFGLGRR
jgi:hypothetical protein